MAPTSKGRLAQAVRSERSSFSDENASRRPSLLAIINGIE
jgi:hypothetical protein